MMGTCTICDHPPHDGRHCFAPITKDISFPVGSIIFTRTATVSNCACALVDEIISNLGIDASLT
jgi:hypothetical protein